MTETTLILLAASTAAAMAFLVRAGVSPSLRAAIRTSLVLVLGWSLAYRAQHEVARSSLPLRLWLMVGLSLTTVGIAWGLYFHDCRRSEPSAAAIADRINVYIAAAFAVLLILGPVPQRYAFAVLLVSGAVILAAKKG